jgi:hypothetical protein
MANKISVSISNTDIIPLALLDLGGAGKFIDVEDLFMRCYEISPERFGWRKYQYPNYKILYQALVDFDRKHPELIIRTPDGLSRQLSAEGVKWIEQRYSIFRKLLETPEKIPPTRRPNQRILNDISKHSHFRSYLSEGSIDLSKYQVAEILLCSPDSQPSLWKERLETYRSAALQSKRKDIVSFLDYLFNKYPALFGGD